MGTPTEVTGESQDAQFVLPLFDAESGDLLALVDATRVGLVGSGTQARGQLLYDRACEQRVGETLELSPASEAFP